jgi:hypothetical protein
MSVAFLFDNKWSVSGADDSTIQIRHAKDELALNLQGTHLWLFSSLKAITSLALMMPVSVFGSKDTFSFRHLMNGNTKYDWKCV